MTVNYPQNAWFTGMAEGDSITYRWQVNDGTGFVDIFDGEKY
jgi:hypothetical protein